MKVKHLALAAAIALLGTGAAHAANIVNNGSFEDVTSGFDRHTDDNELYTSDSSGAAIAGWTVYTDELSWIGPTNSYGLSAPVGGGSYFLDLTGTSDDNIYGGIRQTLATTAGSTYLLSFQLGGRAEYGLPAGLIATAGGASMHFVTTDPDPANAGFWQTQTLQFVASGSSTDLSFIGTNSHANVGLDLVSVEEIAGPVPGVPEPSSWALMMAGVGATGLALRRRKTQTASAAAA
jgi:hypothetical protein